TATPRCGRQGLLQYLNPINLMPKAGDMSIVPQACLWWPPLTASQATSPEPGPWLMQSWLHTPPRHSHHLYQVHPMLPASVCSPPAPSLLPLLQSAARTTLSLLW
uniref:Uncharacterized protein n=1 Tax=Falco tinnunculus TaxID=100819 RepID=A0A8C4UQV9_FALTI